MKTTTIRLPDALHKTIRQQALEENISMNAWIEQVLTNAIFHGDPNLNATLENRFDDIENMVGYCTAGIENNCDINDAEFNEWNDAEHAAEVYLDHLPLKPTVPKAALDRINDVLCGMKIAEEFYKNKE